jgi:hypothetical protein
MASWDHDDLKDKSLDYLDKPMVPDWNKSVPKQKKVPSSRGPSPYYDQPYSDWVTTNDQMEWLAENKWGKYAIHLKDIFKGLCRWGEKEGTDIEYDTRKIIYYGLRVLRMVVGVEKTREYLNSLLNDKQFGGK